MLFAGQYWPGANTGYLARAFERCGVMLRWLNETALWPAWTQPGSRILRRALFPLITSEWNRQLLNLVDNYSPDLVYIANGQFCRPQTIKSIQSRSIPVVCFYHDVVWKDIALSKFSACLTDFDLLLTSRNWQADEFRAAGARRVQLVRFGFDPDVHRPVELSPAARRLYGAQATLIGTFENKRRRDLEALLAGEPHHADFNYEFKLWGGFWDRLPPESRLRKRWQGRAVQEQEIPAIYAASQAALHWVGWEPDGIDPALRQGDQHNSRTFQIPACGGAIMVAQRTPEHLAFFTENVEAIYFDDVAELRTGLDYWLDPRHEPERLAMAVAARRRCLDEDYSYAPVASSILEAVGLPVVNG